MARLSYTRRVLIAVAVTAAAVLLLVFLWYTVDVLLLAFAGVLLAIFLRSLSDWLSARTGLSAGSSLGLVVAALLGLTALGLWLLAPTVADQVNQLSQRLPEAAMLFQRPARTLQAITRRHPPSLRGRHRSNCVRQNVQVIRGFPFTSSTSASEPSRVFFGVLRPFSGLRAGSDGPPWRGPW